ncbi:MAG: gliding motility-associated C-terminal domain-containing protein [Chryseotalea sp.]
MRNYFLISLFFSFGFALIANRAQAQCTGTTISSFTLTGSTNVSCFNGSNGSISVTLSGGQAPFSYSLVVDTGSGELPIETISNSNLQTVTFNNLFASDVIGGTYRVVVITSNGGTPVLLCTRRQVSGINITQPTQLAFNAPTITPSCNGNDGSISISATGGTAPYSFDWSITPDPGNITNPSGLAAGSYDVTVTDANGCTATQTNIVVPGGATVDAGTTPVEICSGSTFTLAGTVGGSATGGVWSGGAGTFSNPNALNAVYTPAGTDLVNGTVTLTLTTTGGGCPSIFDQITINLANPPTVEAGNPQTICGSTTGSPLVGSSIGGSATTGAWGIVSQPVGGNGSLSSTAQTANPSAVTFAATVAGNYTLRLTTNDPANACTSVFDDVIITVEAPPTVEAGANATICGGSSRTLVGSSFGGTATIVTWSVFSGPVGGDGVISGTNPTTTPASNSFTATVPGTYVLRLTTDNPPGICDAVFDQVTITVNNPATVFAGADKAACAGSVVALSDATRGGGSANATWSIVTQPVGGNGSLSNTTALANPATVTFTATVAGNYTLRLTTNNPAGPCNAVSDDVIITLDPAATVEAGTYAPICSGAILPLANATIGGSASTGTWSIIAQPGSGDGNLSLTTPTATPATVTFTATVAGNYTLRLTTDDPANNCPSVFDEVTITVNPVVVPSVAIVSDLGNTICSGATVNFTATPTNGGTTPTYQWRINGTNVPAATNSTFTSSTLNNADIVTVEMVSNATCATPSTVLSNSINFTVNPTVTPSVTIAVAPGTTICSSTNATFTATPVNGGASPTYQWQINSVNVAGATSSTFSTTTLNDNDQVRVILTSNATCPVPASATSNVIVMDVTPSVVPTVSITANPGSTVCPSTSVTFNSTITNGGTTPAYQWRINGADVLGETSSTFTTSTLSNGDVVTLRLTSNATCAIPSAVTSTGITMTVASPLTASVSVTTAPGTSVCAGTNVTFTAVPVNGGATPTYQWILNGGDVVGQTASTFNTNTLANNDQVSVRMTSSLNCAVPATVTSSIVTMTVTNSVTPSVSITSSDADNSICAGTSVTFTATPVNGGTTPTFQWLSGGTPIAGQTGSTFVTSTLTNGEVISVSLTSNATCAAPATVTSNTIATTVLPVVTPAVTISSSDADNSICAGTSVTFTATPTNGGTTPAFQWFSGVNPIAGETNTTLTTTGLINGEQISVSLTSNATCASPVTVASNTITTNVLPAVTPTISITSNDADNTICAGTSVTFTAAITNGGTTPAFQWLLNGNPVAGETNNTFTTSTLSNNDQVSVQLISNALCATTTTVVSNTITISVPGTTTPSVTITSSDADNSICAGTSITFTATPVNGGATPAFQWLLNGNPIVGQTTATLVINTLVNNDNISVQLTSSSPCAVPLIATSNVLNHIVLPLVTPSVVITSNDADNIICAGTSVTFTATPTNGGAAPTFQWLSNGNPIVGETNATYTTTGLTNGEQISVTVTSNEVCPSPVSATSSSITNTVNPILTPAVTLSINPGATICPGTSVTFTANITNGGSTPTLQWSKNGIPLAGETNTTYTDATLANNDVISVTLTSSAACVSSATVSANQTITVSPNPTATISGTTSICVGGNADVTITLTGVAPWDIVYSDGVTNISASNILTSPYVFNVAPTAPGATYTMVSVSDACGAGTVSGSADVAVTPIPGNPNTFGTETWIGYVYDDFTTTPLSPYQNNVNYNLAKYRGFFNETELAAFGTSSYNTSTDVFNLNLSNNIPLQGANICGSYLNNFSVRFRMSKTFTAGVYTFQVGGDDGVRLIIDGVAITLSPANSFTNHSYTVYTSAPVCLTAGAHQIQIEYFENAGFSRVSFDYNATPAPVPNPASPIVTCLNATVPTLSVNAITGATGYNWFADAALTTLLSTTATPNFTPTAAQLDMTTVANNDFYVTATFACGQTQAAQINVNVVNSTTITPIVNPLQVCQSATPVDLNTLVNVVPASAVTFAGTGVTASNFDASQALGVYTINATVGGACPANVTFSIEIIDDAVITVPAVDPTVCQASAPIDLSTLVSASPVGGTFTFTGTGVNSGTGTFDPSSLTGLQTINVSYTSGTCVANTTFEINVVSSPVLTVTPPATPRCENGGVINLLAFVSANPAGGTFTFSGSPAITGSTLNPAALGGSTVSINVSYDLGGCTSASSFNITITDSTDPSCGSGTGTCATVVITPTPSPATCTLSNGSIFFDISPAVPVINNTGVIITINRTTPASPVFSRTNVNNFLFNGLPIGTYEYTIQYGDPGCIKTGFVTVDQSGTVGIPIASNIVSPTCVGDTNGSATIDVFGETGNVLEWSLDGGIADPFKSFTAGNQITGIPAGPAPTFNQVISIRRNASDPCFAQVTINIPPPSPINFTAVTTNTTTCTANDGTIQVTGTAGNQVAIFDGTGTTQLRPFTSLPIATAFSGFSPGSYIVTVRNAVNCEASQTIGITAPNPVGSPTDVSFINAVCANNGASGVITIAQLPVVGTYDLTIERGLFTPVEVVNISYSGEARTFNNLISGDYRVIIQPTGTSTLCPLNVTGNISGPVNVSFQVQTVCLNDDLQVSNITGNTTLSLQFEVRRISDNQVVFSDANVTPFPTGSYLIPASTTFLTQAGDYALILSQTQGTCTLTQTTNVTINEAIVVEESDFEKSYPDESAGAVTIKIVSGGVAPYAMSLELTTPFTPGQSFSSPLTEVTTQDANFRFFRRYTQLPAGTYNYVIEDDNGCRFVDELDIEVNQAIFIPNVFTPDKDADKKNEFFTIRNLAPNSKLVVTNRWGNEVYANNNYDNTWDGGDLPEGVYFYQLNSGGNKYSGWVEIIRGSKP